MTTPRYRTIVADPPWDHGGGLPAPPYAFQHGRGRSETPYSRLAVAEIAALPVADLAAPDAHLYLWTTNRFLPQSWSVAKAWGFDYSTMLVWCKAPRGLVGGAAFTIAAEYVLFCRRGSLSATTRLDRNWFEWTRQDTYGHSGKPDAFLDIVESVSPGPYLELFARRQRLGWDTWGDEALNHVTLEGAA